MEEEREEEEKKEENDQKEEQEEKNPAMGILGEVLRKAREEKRRKQ